MDIRYVLWLMDYVDRAHHLLRELGFEPAAPVSTAAVQVE